MALFTRLIVCIGLFVLVFPLPTLHAQSGSAPVEYWTRYTFGYAPSKKWRQDFEMQYRHQQANAQLNSRFQLYTFRWYVFYNLKTLQLQLSPFTYFYRTAGKDKVKEFRLMQMVSVPLKKDRVYVRAGLEERFFETAADRFTEWRFRGRLLFSRELNRSMSWTVSDEVFFHHRFSGPSVVPFDQNRLSAFFTIRISPVWQMETGYSFQSRKLTSGEIDHFHVFSTYLRSQLPKKS